MLVAGRNEKEVCGTRLIFVALRGDSAGKLRARGFMQLDE